MVCYYGIKNSGVGVGDRGVKGLGGRMDDHLLFGS